MRDAFFRSLLAAARKDERVMLVTADMGFGCSDEFAREFPGRFLNVGVAEQNMTSVAVGLALEGRCVFTYSIANFPTLRCLEQIRNDVCYHRANVKVVSVGGGMSYGALGVTHFATEDLAVMRAMPEMTVVAPGDPLEAEAATRAACALEGPFYLRLGRAGETAVHASPPEFKLGKAIRIRPGSDATIISTGAMLPVCVKAAEQLGAAGVACRVVSMHTLKPFDEDEVERAAVETPAVVTVEEHSIIGGLGSCVAEVLAGRGLCCKFSRVALPDAFCRDVGSQEYLRERMGLTPDAVADRVRALLAG